MKSIIASPLLSHAVRAALAAGLAASAGVALANTGRIQFVNGNVTVQNAAGQSRAATTGMEVGTGDTVRTHNGLVQIRYSDGAIVSLQQDAEYTIQNYRFAGKADGSEQGIFRLIKGTMRTITGLVGRTHRAAYALNTPTATIGIRGTGGVIDVNPVTGATTLYGTSGTWDLRSQTGGSIGVSAGQTGRTTTSSEPAQQTSTNAAQPSATASAQPDATQNDFMVAEFRTDTGQTEGLHGDDGSSGGGGGPGLVAPMIGSANSTSVAFTDLSLPYPGDGTVAVTMDGSSLAGWTYEKSGSYAVLNTSTVAGGTLEESGTTGSLTWGRISNTVVTQVYTYNGESYTDIRDIGPNGSLYFITGQATTDMPKSGSFTYSLTGTQMRPSFRNDAPITATLDSSTITGQFTATGGSFTYTLGLTVNGQSLAASGSGSIGQNLLAGYGTGGGAFCGGTCDSSLSGGFFGEGAANIGAGYMIYNAGSTDAVGGSAIYQKQ